MAAIVVSITNDDLADNVTIKQVTKNDLEGNFDPAADVIVLEPGAGTAFTILDKSVMVVRASATEEPPLNTSVAHVADETTTIVPTPE